MNKTFIYLFFLVFFVSSVFAQPPFQGSGTELGAVVLYPKDTAFELDSTFSYHMHFINSSGFAVTAEDFSCYGHFYSTQGVHLAELSSIDDSNGMDDYFVLNKSVTGVLGTVPYNIWCNSSQEEGAYVSSSFVITNDSEEEQFNGGFLVALVLFGIIYLLMKVAVNLDESNHAVMKLFFILSSIWLSVGTLGLAKAVAVVNTGLFSSGALSILDGLWILIITLSVVVSMYFVIYYIYTVFGLFGGLVNKRKGGQR